MENSPINLSDPTGHFTCSSDKASDDYCPGHSTSGGPTPPINPPSGGGSSGGHSGGSHYHVTGCDGDPLCILDAEIGLDDIPGSSEFYSATSKALDITALVVDVSLEVLALTGFVIGALAGAAFVDPVTGLPGEVVKGAAGGAIGWSLIQLGVQPILQLNNVLATVATLAGAVADDKMGGSDINFRTTLSLRGPAVRANGYVSSSTITSGAISAEGFTAAGSLTETSTALQIGAVLNDFGKLPVPSFTVPFSNLPIFHWP